MYSKWRVLAGTVVQGEILVNNRQVGPFMHRLSGFVHQDDLFDGTLTVLEHMNFIVNHLLPQIHAIEINVSSTYKNNIQYKWTILGKSQIGPTN